MNPFAAVAVKTVGAAGVAALLSVGAVSAFAASPSPTPKPPAGATQPSTDRHADRRSISRAEDEAAADVLGISPQPPSTDHSDSLTTCDRRGPQLALQLALALETPGIERAVRKGGLDRATRLRHV